MALPRVNEPALPADANGDEEQPSSVSGIRPRGALIEQMRKAFTSGEFPRAVELSEELLRANPNDAAGHAFAAWASIRAGEGEVSEDELRSALTKLDRAVAMDRACDESVYYRGLVQKRLNNVPAAFRDFARAVQLNPEHTEAESQLRFFAMRVRKGSMPPPAR